MTFAARANAFRYPIQFPLGLFQIGCVAILELLLFKNLAFGFSQLSFQPSDGAFGVTLRMAIRAPKLFPNLDEVFPK